MVFPFAHDRNGVRLRGGVAPVRLLGRVAQVEAPASPVRRGRRVAPDQTGENLRTILNSQMICFHDLKHVGRNSPSLDCWSRRPPSRRLAVFSPRPSLLFCSTNCKKDVRAPLTSIECRFYFDAVSLTGNDSQA